MSSIDTCHCRINHVCMKMSYSCNNKQERTTKSHLSVILFSYLPFLMASRWRHWTSFVLSFNQCSLLFCPNVQHILSRTMKTTSISYEIDFSRTLNHFSPLSDLRFTISFDDNVHKCKEMAYAHNIAITRRKHEQLVRVSFYTTVARENIIIIIIAVIECGTRHEHRRTIFDWRLIWNHQLRIFIDRCRLQRERFDSSESFEHLHRSNRTMSTSEASATKFPIRITMIRCYQSSRVIQSFSHNIYSSLM